MRIKVAVVVGIVIAVGSAAALLREPNPEAVVVPETPTFAVRETTVEDTIEVAGHLRPVQEQELRAPISGILKELPVALNQAVEAGQLIGRIDTSEQDLAVADLKLQWDQEKYLGNQRKADLVLAKIQVQQQAIETLTWRARFRGRVSRLTAQAGDSLKAGELYGKVANLDQLVADVEVPELDLPRVKPGQTVEFRFAALPGKVVSGKVSELGVEGRTNDKGLTVFDARLIIPSPPAALRPGLSFRALIVGGIPRTLAVVEAQAVDYTAGRAQVNRQTDTGWETVPVEVEGFGDGLIRIVSGVVPGDVLMGVTPGSSAPSGGSGGMVLGVSR